MAVDALTFLSANTQGLKTKILQVLQTIQVYDCVMVQEINLLEKRDIDYIKSLYNGEFYYNRPIQGSRATGIFIHNNIVKQAKEIKHTIIVDGQAHQLFVKLPSSSFVILNVYGCPDHDGNVGLFKQINEKFTTIDGSPIIMGGDYNTILDRYLDQEKYSESGLKKIQTGSKQLGNFVERYSLTDIYRHNNIDGKEFTYFKFIPNKCVIKSRIDRLYISNEYIHSVDNHSFVPIDCSDHVATKITLQIKETVHHRPSHWKLNVSLLSDEDLKSKVLDLVSQWRELKPLFHNHVYWWESLKIRIKLLIRTFSKKKRERENAEKDTLVQSLNQKHRSGLNTEDEMLSFMEIKSKLKELNVKRAKSLIIRAREQDIKEDEKMSSYFFRKVKENLNQRNFIGLYDTQGTVKSDNKDMKDVVYMYYSDLYSKEPMCETLQADLLSRDSHRLTETEKQQCEGLLSNAECKKAIFQMRTGRTPGSDGLPAEFYQTFWEFMGDDITDALNAVHIHGELSESQRLALITLLFKKNDIRDLGNWRPISLLNVDLKLISKCLSNRLRNILPRIIVAFQSCGVKGKNIFDNLITLQNLIDLSIQTKRNMFIVGLDQLKAFDRLDHSWMMKVLHHYNFGSSFIKWIHILYNDITSKDIVNGFLTKSIKIERGVRQGCPLSPLLYILAMNPIANDIIQDVQIKGINSYPVLNSITFFSNNAPPTETIKLLAYADDMCCTLKDERSVEILITKFKTYEKITGSKLNVNKTEIMTIGNPIVETINNDLIKNSMKILGIYFNGQGACTDQWNPIIDKIKRLLNRWSTRNLTTRGRAILATTIGLAQLWYTAKMVPISKPQCKEIEKLIYNFIWKRDYDPIKRNILTLPYCKGGLNIPDIKLKCDLLLSHRITNLCNENTRKIWADLSLYWLRDSLSVHHPFLRTNRKPKSTTLSDTNKCITNLYNNFQNSNPINWTDKSLKDLYNHTKNLDIVPSCEQKEPQFNWIEIWKFISPFHYDKNVWDTSWNIIHASLPTGEHKFRRNLLLNNNDNKCFLCGAFESNSHLFFTCDYAKTIIEIGKKVIKEKTGYDGDIQQNDFIFHTVYKLPVSDETKKIISNIWGVMKYTIWKYRNIVKSGENANHIMLRVHFKIEISYRLK